MRRNSNPRKEKLSSFFRSTIRLLSSLISTRSFASSSLSRLSTPLAALKAVGCERIVVRRPPAGAGTRPELHRLLDHLRKGDVLVRRCRRLLLPGLRLAENRSLLVGPCGERFGALTTGWPLTSGSPDGQLLDLF